MQEVDWVNSFIAKVNEQLSTNDNRLRVFAGKKLPYAYEVQYYRNDDKPESRYLNYETDILVVESVKDYWKPRVVVEAKVERITTHDAITYSQKAATHKQVHPYLRYGILIGKRGHYPLPGRLFRHGSHFDFMVSWVGEQASPEEFDNFIELLLEEVAASRLLEEIIYESRSSKRTRYTLLQKRLILR